MQFANAILQQSAVILLIDFAVNQMKVVPASSVDVTSDKTAVRFCAFFGYFFCASKKSDWPAGQKHGNGKRSTKNKAPPPCLQKKTPFKFTNTLRKELYLSSPNTITKAANPNPKKSTD